MAPRGICRIFLPSAGYASVHILYNMLKKNIFLSEKLFETDAKKNIFSATAGKETAPPASSPFPDMQPCPGDSRRSRRSPAGPFNHVTRAFLFETLCVSNHTVCCFEKTQFFRCIPAWRRCAAASRFPFFKDKTLCSARKRKNYSSPARRFFPSPMPLPCCAPGCGAVFPVDLRMN